MSSSQPWSIFLMLHNKETTSIFMNCYEWSVFVLWIAWLTNYSLIWKVKHHHVPNTSSSKGKPLILNCWKSPGRWCVQLKLHPQNPKFATSKEIDQESKSSNPSQISISMNSINKLNQLQRISHMPQKHLSMFTRRLEVSNGGYDKYTYKHTNKPFMS